MFRLVVLPRFDLCRSNSVHVVRITYLLVHSSTQTPNTVFTLGKCNALVWFGAVRYSY